MKIISLKCNPRANIFNFYYNNHIRIIKKDFTMSKVTIRPNLNTTDHITIHNGRLGKKIDSVRAVTINCSDIVLRASGRDEAFLKHNKTVHAGLIGKITNLIMPKESDSLVKYNPHDGDDSFTVDGKLYVGGGTVTMIGHKAYLVLKG